MGPSHSQSPDDNSHASQPDDYNHFELTPFNEQLSVLDALNTEHRAGLPSSHDDASSIDISDTRNMITRRKSSLPQGVQKRQQKHPRGVTLTTLQPFTNRRLSSILTACRDHNPFNPAGRVRIRNFILRSGQAYHPADSGPTESVNETEFTGWRMGALLNIILLTICLAVEIVMLVSANVADRRNSGSPPDGILYSGNCDYTRRWKSTISLAINIIATITIGSSNYIMQCLEAPSASELRQAHSHGCSMSIGFSSPFNIPYISKTKMLLWWIMAITSLPVHLLFNSAFFASLQANNYAMAIVSNDFKNESLWASCPSNNTASWPNLACTLYDNSTDQSQYERLDNAGCIERYSEPLLNKYGNVILVSTSSSSQRNDTLGFMWSNQVSLRESALDFTSLYEIDGSSSNEDFPRFDDSLIELKALLGIFTSFEYNEWLIGYDEGFSWALNVSVLNETVTDAKFPNGTTWGPNTLEAAILTPNISSYGQTPIELDLKNGPTVEGYIWNGTTINSTFSNAFLNGSLPTRLAPGFYPTGWLCGDNYTSYCSISTALENAQAWKISPHRIGIDYCISQKTARAVCELKYSSAILAVVIGCDIVKILVILIALRLKEEPLVTVGDVLSHFVRNPEPATKELCLLDQDRAEYCYSELCFPIDFSRVSGGLPVNKFIFGDSPWAWVEEKRLRRQTVSPLSWLLLSLVMLSGYAGSVSLFIIGYLDVRPAGGNSNTQFTRGLFEADPNAVFSATSSPGNPSASRFLQQVLIVNSPQLFFSFMYIIYNGMLTAMHAAIEWSKFATERKPLRVSHPRRGQRSSYWLSLPWSYSLPLVAASALLHWLVSQSLYLVDINVLGPYGTLQESQSIFACGFNILMLLMVLAVLTVLTVAMYLFSCRSLGGNIHVVGTNSMALSAACHHRNDPATEACKPLLWGVIDDPQGDEPGHCALSSGEVHPPTPGQCYW